MRRAVRVLGCIALLGACAPPALDYTGKACPTGACPQGYSCLSGACAPTVGCNAFKRYLEVESFSADGFYPVDDPRASCGRYLTSLTIGAVLSIPVELPAGTFIVWARVLAPDPDRDSFLVSVDGGPDDVFDLAEGTWSADWQWNAVNGRGSSGKALALDPRTFELPAGPHVFHFRMREAESTLDRLMFTDAPCAAPRDEE